MSEHPRPNIELYPVHSPEWLRNALSSQATLFLEAVLRDVHLRRREPLSPDPGFLEFLDQIMGHQIDKQTRDTLLRIVQRHSHIHPDSESKLLQILSHEGQITIGDILNAMGVFTLKPKFDHEPVENPRQAVVQLREAGQSPDSAGGQLFVTEAVSLALTEAYRAYRDAVAHHQAAKDAQQFPNHALFYGRAAEAQLTERERQIQTFINAYKKLIEVFAETTFTDRTKIVTAETKVFSTINTPYIFIQIGFSSFKGLLQEYKEEFELLRPFMADQSISFTTFTPEEGMLILQELASACFRHDTPDPRTSLSTPNFTLKLAREEETSLDITRVTTGSLGNPHITQIQFYIETNDDWFYDDIKDMLHSQGVSVNIP